MTLPDTGKLSDLPPTRLSRAWRSLGRPDSESDPSQKSPMLVGAIGWRPSDQDSEPLRRFASGELLTRHPWKGGTAVESRWRGTTENRRIARSVVLSSTVGRCAVTCWNVFTFTACPGMEARFWRWSSKFCQGAFPRSGDLQVGLDRVCACATLPLSGAGRF